MKRFKLFASVACVGLCAVAAMFAGCAESNPTLVSEEAGGDFAITASVVPAGQVTAAKADTVINNDNVNFVVIDKNGKKDSVTSSTYDYGDGSAWDAHIGLANGTHRFTAVGTYLVTLHVLMINGVAQQCSTHIVVVLTKSAPQPASSKDSVFKWISSSPVGSGTNVFNVAFGTLIEAVTTANPFQEGFDDWTVPILLNNQPLSANGRLYLVTKALTGGTFYNVGIGKRWNGTKENSVWLTPAEQAGNRLYNPNKEIMSFYFGYNGYPYSLDSIPADSGRGILPPVTVDTTHPGTYGDAGANWRVRFQDIIHSTVVGGQDSLIVYCSLHGLEACSTSTAVMTSNISGKATINLIRPAGKLYAYAIIAVAEIPATDGLIWNYSWGNCVQASNTGSIFWSYTVNGVIFAFQARWVPYAVSLPKRTGQAEVGHLVQF